MDPIFVSTGSHIRNLHLSQPRVTRLENSQVRL